MTIEEAKKRHQLIILLRSKLADARIHLEEEKPILAYKRLLDIDNLLYDSSEGLSKIFPHELG